MARGIVGERVPVGASSHAVARPQFRPTLVPHLLQNRVSGWGCTSLSLPQPGWMGKHIGL